MYISRALGLRNNWCSKQRQLPKKDDIRLALESALILLLLITVIRQTSVTLVTEIGYLALVKHLKQ